MNGAVNAKHRKISIKSLLFSVLIGLFVGAAIIFLILFLYAEPESLSTKVVCAQANPMETMILKETSPPTEPTEPTTEPIDYEMQIDLQRAKDYHAVNKEVIGWVYINDTAVNYPIMQAYDNVFYMNHNWQKQYSYSGSIFADWRCLIDESENSLLYGHNMGNGSMFHAVKYYKDPEWGKEHPYFEVATLEKRFLYKVLSVNVVNGLEGADFEYWNCVNMNRREYAEYVQNIYDTSTVWYGDEEHLPQYGKDRLIALQTCDSGSGNGIRCVLFAQCLGEF